MREVLRHGQTQGRVALADVVGPQSVAVGALAGLAGEITVDGGTVHLAEVVDPTSPDGLRVRDSVTDEEATLLVLAEVAAWSVHALPDVDDLTALERVVRSTADAAGIDVNKPFPFRLEGRTRTLRLHVLHRSCPIARPNGPPPWTLDATDTPAVLIGFYADGSAGTLTHHGRRSHIHALVPGLDVSGHLDAASLLSGTRLYLPSF